MTMFRYFPGNEGWSYHFAARIVNVAQLGGADFHEAHRVLEKVKVGDGEGWYHAWQSGRHPQRSDRHGCQRSGRPITARDAYLRAHNYFRTAQFFCSAEIRASARPTCAACRTSMPPYPISTTRRNG